MPQEPDPKDITGLLGQWTEGDHAARDELIGILYNELRAVAHNRLRAELAGKTLDTTELVHETYLKLIGSKTVAWSSRAHFLAIAARQMRQILVDRARRRSADKRGGPIRPETLDETLIYNDASPRSLLDIDDALARLAEVSKRAERVVEMRFFAGMTMKEIAQELAVSVATIERDWSAARAWLMRDLAVTA